jgi:hypothetical protein
MKGSDGGRGGGAKPERKEKPTKNGAEAQTKRKLNFFCMRSAQEEGNVDNAFCNNGGGISMVHRCGLKNLLTVKVRSLKILKLRTTRKKWAKDRPTVCEGLEEPATPFFVMVSSVFSVGSLLILVP